MPRQPAHDVEMGVGPKRERVAPVAEQSEPFGVAHDDVELVAVNDEIAASVGGDMDGVRSMATPPKRKPQ